MPDAMVKEFFDYYARQGWYIKPGIRMVSLASGLSTWKANQPSRGRKSDVSKQPENPIMPMGRKWKFKDGGQV
jgi:hypothetical protein